MAPDYVRAADYEDAIELLLWVEAPYGGRYRIDTQQAPQAPVSESGRRKRLHACAVLTAKLDAYFCGLPPLRTEQQAHAALKTFALHLRDAALALQASAECMKRKGDLAGANVTYRAYLKARDEAAGILGEV